jgi:hypothetical protein
MVGCNYQIANLSFAITVSATTKEQRSSSRRVYVLRAFALFVRSGTKRNARILFRTDATWKVCVFCIILITCQQQQISCTLSAVRYVLLSTLLLSVVKYNMGSSTSALQKQQKPLTQQERDIVWLGERFPFGDAELHDLYEAYQTILLLKNSNTSTSKRSLLQDMGVACFKGADPVERATLLQVAEREILPNNYGTRLYATAFIISNDNDVFGYLDNNKNMNSADQNTSATDDDSVQTLRLEAFFDGISNAGRRGSKQALHTLYNSVRSQETTCANAFDLVQVAYRIALATSFLKVAAEEDGDVALYIPKEDDNLQQLQSLANSMLRYASDKKQSKRGDNAATKSYTAPHDVDTTGSQQGSIPADDFVEWCEYCAPMFASILSTFVWSIFSPNRPYPPSRTCFDFPVPNLDSNMFESPRSPLLFTFGCLSSSLRGTYFRLYTSDNDGLSFNRLQNALLGYSGPTLLVIRSADNGIFGAFTASPWKESKDFYGDSDCFLFQIAPTTAVYRPTGNACNYMYCNSFARSRGYDQQAHGLGFGGTVDEPRLFLAENFDDCVAAGADMTFENGSLLPQQYEGGVVVSKRSHFAIDSVEVWGVGGDDVVQQALGERDKVREIKDIGIRRARKVDKAQFLDDFRSGAISSKAFGYREQIDGRADLDVKDRHAATDQK